MISISLRSFFAATPIASSEGELMPRANGKRSAGPAEEHEISVYSGTTFLGTVKGGAGKYVARDARRRRLGKFRSVQKAADAISERCSESAE
jgi:hypothetical protein